jgi:hypothetical protein
MKRWFIVFWIFVIVNSLLITSQTPDLFGENINQETGQIEIIDDLTDEEKREDFIRTEWGKILDRNKYIGPLLRGLNEISPFTDPIVRYTVGMEPRLTWLFVVTFVLWWTLVIYGYRLLELVSVFSNLVQVVLSFGLVIIFSLLGGTKWIAELIINTIALFDIWWVQLIGGIVVIIIIVLLGFFSKQLELFFEAMKKRRKELKRDIEHEKMKGEVEVAEAYTRSLTK